MKLCRIIALFGALIASTIPDAFAASPALKVQVPFAFTVGNRKMPPGEYTIASNGGASGIYSIRGAGQGVLVLSSPLAFSASDIKTPGLVFETKGSEHHLIGIRTDADTGRSVAMSSLSASR